MNWLRVFKTTLAGIARQIGVASDPGITETLIRSRFRLFSDGQRAVGLAITLAVVLNKQLGLPLGKVVARALQRFSQWRSAKALAERQTLA